MANHGMAWAQDIVNAGAGDAPWHPGLMCVESLVSIFLSPQVIGLQCGLQANELLPTLIVIR